MREEGRPQRDTLLAIVVIVLVAALASESALGVIGQASRSPSASASARVGPNGTVQLSVMIPATSGRLSMHVAAISSHTLAQGRPDRIYVLLDTRFPGLYISYPDEEFVALHLIVFLDRMAANVPVIVVRGDQVAAALASDPHAALVIAGTPAPSSVLSPNSTQLAQWIRHGGTLFWAGGPLGFASGSALPGGGFRYDSLFWQGQISLVGFPLTDPGVVAKPGTASRLPPPPLYGVDPSPLATALGIAYSATPDGANATRLAAHGEVSLGFEAPSSGNPSAGPWTSLAYVPVGSGGVFYFGGGDLSSYQGYVPYVAGWIVDGSVDVSRDISLLAGLGIVPAALPFAQTDVVSSTTGPTLATLTLPNTTGGIAVFVESGTVGEILYFWSEWTSTAQLLSQSGAWSTAAAVPFRKS